MVRTLPSLQALRRAYPEASISWLVERGAASVLDGHPDLDAVIEFPRASLTKAFRSGHFGDAYRVLRRFIALLRSEHFDLVIDFHAIAKSALIAWSSRAPMRVSYAIPFGREWSWLFATHRARLSPAKISRYDRNAGLLAYLAIDSGQASARLPRDPVARARMRRALASSDPFVLIHPGSSEGTAYKRYRASGYAAVARELMQSCGLQTLVTLGTSPAEEKLAQQIVAAAAGAARLAPHTPLLSDLIALIDAARLYVGGDSGPLHVATALGTPAVQILGPTDPIENEPCREAVWKRVRVALPCSPCRSGCAAATCMTILPHEQIVEAAMACLERNPAEIRLELQSPDISRAFTAVQ